MEFHEIIALEKKLLDSSVRKNPADLREILSSEFFEIGTSGNVYDRATAIDRLSKEVSPSIEAMEFKGFELAPNIVQLRFKTRTKKEDGNFSASLRSSIWKFIDGRWQMIFHQGTTTSL